MARSKNPFFRFKQFTIWHDQCALKVCTEACILGSYTDVDNAQRVLDIGTGTGLLALMMAQRNVQLHIDAVEIEKACTQQALENVRQSPFNERISVFHSPIQRWESSTKYDLIVSNPPFFANHLRATDTARNRALHDETLSLEDLAMATHRLLTENGRFVVLLPPYQTQTLTHRMAALGMFPAQQLHIFQRPHQPLFRQITTFKRQSSVNISQILYIHESDGTYSASFKTLLKEYYLML